MCMSRIFSETLCKCMRVCRRWRDFCEEPCIWKRLCTLPRSFRMCSKEAECEQLRKHTTCDGTVLWKNAFSERYRLWRNWHAGRCVIRTFQGHTQGITRRLDRSAKDMLFASKCRNLHKQISICLQKRQINGMTAV